MSLPWRIFTIFERTRAKLRKVSPGVSREDLERATQDLQSASEDDLDRARTEARKALRTLKDWDRPE